MTRCLVVDQQDSITTIENSSQISLHQFLDQVDLIEEVIGRRCNDVKNGDNVLVAVTVSDTLLVAMPQVVEEASSIPTGNASTA
jgi:hypothetical protein